MANVNEGAVDDACGPVPSSPIRIRIGSRMHENDLLSVSEAINSLYCHSGTATTVIGCDHRCFRRALKHCQQARKRAAFFYEGGIGENRLLSSRK
jgi:hypothetical protein